MRTERHGLPWPPQRPIAACVPRRRACCAGVVIATSVREASGLALRVSVGDGTGELVLVFFGRREIPGLVPGAVVRVAGVVQNSASPPTMLNPRYELLG